MLHAGIPDEGIFIKANVFGHVMRDVCEQDQVQGDVHKYCECVEDDMGPAPRVRGLEAAPLGDNCARRVQDQVPDRNYQPQDCGVNHATGLLVERLSCSRCFHPQQDKVGVRAPEEDSPYKNQYHQCGHALHDLTYPLCMSYSEAIPQQRCGLAIQILHVYVMGAAKLVQGRRQCPQHVALCAEDNKDSTSGLHVCESLDRCWAAPTFRCVCNAAFITTSLPLVLWCLWLPDAKKIALN
mmetsp:Transcript_95084/g.238414  ORF Transcript_95084/g.238414 Transcript_95084/m.238414 type:complete len:239 (+) Transcript_95084:817-1533(+)